MNSAQFRALIVAIVIHMLVVLGAFYWHVSGKGAESYSVRMVFQEEKETPEEVEEPKEKAKPRNDRWNEYDEANTNEAVNKALDNLTEAQRKAIDEKITEDVRQLAEETSESGLNSDPSNREALSTEDNKTVETPSDVEKASDQSEEIANTHNDPTNITYFLKERKHLYGRLVNPVYLCEEGGVVRVEIEVSPAGRVVNTSVVGSKSVRAPCLRDAAVKAASESQFNAGSNQKGWIEYRFIPQ